MSNARLNRFAPRSAILLGLAALTLAGCSSTFDLLPEKMGGLPESAPPRPAEVGPYPNVYQPMAPREVKKLNEGEQKSTEQELLALRQSQTLRVNPPPPPPPARKAAASPPAKKQAAKKTPDVKAAEKKPPEKKPPDKQAN
jgi:hypothetical protein